MDEPGHQISCFIHRIAPAKPVTGRAWQIKLTAAKITNDSQAHQKQQMQQLLEQEKRASLENKVKLDDMYARSVDRFNQIQRMANSVLTCK